MTGPDVRQWVARHGTSGASSSCVPQDFGANVADMSSRAEHLAAGAFVGFLTELLHADRHKRPVNTRNVVLSALGGAFGSRLPDVIEPPIHPHHRDTAHSVVAGAGVALAVLDSDGEAPEKAFLRGAGAGYVTHLAQDASTPRSIPLLTRRRR